MMRVAFPDYRFIVEDLIGDGDKVVARVTVTGTHRGEMMGLAPTHKRVQTNGIEVFRLEDGKLAELWATVDALGMLRQLGMVPVPKPPLLLRTPEAPDAEVPSTTLIRFSRLLVPSRSLTT